MQARHGALLLSVAIAACGGRAGSAASAEPAADPIDRDQISQDPARGAIHGVVRDLGSGGRAVSFAQVVVGSVDSADEADSVSDSKGRYRIANLPPGRYKVVATYADMRVFFDGVLITAGQATRVNIDFDSRRRREEAAAGEGPKAPESGERTGTIYGRVVDNLKGEPFPGAVVSAFYPGLSDTPVTVVDADGNYRLVGLAPETYTLSVYYQLIDKGGVEVRRTGVQVEPGGSTRVDLEIDTRIQR